MVKLVVSFLVVIVEVGVKLVVTEVGGVKLDVMPVGGVKLVVIELDGVKLEVTDAEDSLALCLDASAPGGLAVVVARTFCVVVKLI